MPNVSHNLEPRYEDEIDADVIDAQIVTVSNNGYTSVEGDYDHHLIAWIPFEAGGQLKTKSYNQNEKKRVQSYVQEGGSINIGTEEWANERISVLVLDETLNE